MSATTEIRAKPFNVPATRPAVSLLDIMDEELAFKLHETEHVAAFPKDIESEFDDEELDEDLKLALQLSAAEAKSQDEDKGAVATPKEDPVDKDFLLALQLQNQLNDEQYARHIAEKVRLSHNQSKVSTSWDLHYQEEYKDVSETYYTQEYDGLDEESGSSSEEEPEEGGDAPAKEIISKHDPQIAGIKNSHAAERMLDRGNLKNIRLSTPVFNALVHHTKKQQGHVTRVRGNKLDKSTSEQVMDQRTRVLVLKFINSQLLSEVNGVVSTGKEANVYHAVGGDAEPAKRGVEYAIKIFKTTLNEFKNRADYVEGEFRFRRQSLHNPRKLIKLWAEKEMRNLKRLQTGGVRCPAPLILKENVLAMTFIGKDGTPAPRLKDIHLTSEKQRGAYLQVIKLMRKMYQGCRLVHGDLSEYNLLYMKGQVWVIDVSQAVEHTHPKALEFLRRDCECITTFFQGVENCMSTRDLFEFIVDINLAQEDEDKYIAKVEEVIATRDPQEANKQDYVFRNSFIPRTLHQVKKPADEIFGEEDDVYHQAVNGLKPSILGGSDEEEDSEGDSEGYSDSDCELEDTQQETEQQAQDQQNE